MILVMGSFRMPVENYEKALPLMQAVIAATRAEDGCFVYAYSRDALDPELIRVSERWRDRAALDTHMRTAHMATWIAAREELGLFGRDITVFEADEGVAL